MPVAQDRRGDLQLASKEDDLRVALVPIGWTEILQVGFAAIGAADPEHSGLHRDAVLRQLGKHMTAHDRLDVTSIHTRLRRSRQVNRGARVCRATRLAAWTT